MDQNIVQNNNNNNNNNHNNNDNQINCGAFNLRLRIATSFGVNLHIFLCIKYS